MHGNAARPCGNAVSGCNARETTGRPLQPRWPAVLRRVYAVAGGRWGVMGNVHAVDSYCFVIGPCDGTRPRSHRATRRRILREGRFIGNFPRPTSGFPRFSRSRGRDDACQRAALFHVRFLPTPAFALFFLRFFFTFSFFLRAASCKIRGFRVNPSLLLNQSS